MALRTRVSISAIGSLVTYPDLLPYQLALTTPGTSPFSASCRKHSRQIPYLRRNARGLPQRQHRLRWRHLNFGFLRSFAILAVVAIKLSSPLLLTARRYCARNGIPICFSSANPSASVRAVVVMQTFIPLVLSTF